MFHPDRKEPELTIPTVALSATAVGNVFDHDLTTLMWQYKFFAAVYEWHEGKEAKMSLDSSKAAKAEKFKGNNFKKVYDQHVKTLSKLKNKVNTYHQVMPTLYSKIVYISTPNLLINILLINLYL